MAGDAVREALVLPCVMSGESETLTVIPIGQFGVSFAYGPDASVIVAKSDLYRVRSIIDQQLANWAAVERAGGDDDG